MVATAREANTIINHSTWSIWSTIISNPCFRNDIARRRLRFPQKSAQMAWSISASCPSGRIQRKCTKSSAKSVQKRSNGGQMLRRSIQFSATGFSAEKYPNNENKDYLRRLLDGKVIHGGVETPSVCVTFTGYKWSFWIVSQDWWFLSPSRWFG